MKRSATNSQSVSENSYRLGMEESCAERPELYGNPGSEGRQGDFKGVHTTPRYLISMVLFVWLTLVIFCVEE